MRNAAYGMPIAGLWLAWLIYWSIAARNVKAVSRAESAGSRLAHLIPLLLGGALMAFPDLPAPWLYERFLPRTWVAYWTGVAFLTLGLAFTVWARAHLGRNWSGIVTLKHDHELIRTGPYGYVRHPIYTGLLLALLGTVVALGEWRGLIALVVMAGGLLFKLRQEERFLRDIFRDQYDRYRAEVPTLIPCIFCVHRRTIDD